MSDPDSQGGLPASVPADGAPSPDTEAQANGQGLRPSAEQSSPVPGVPDGPGGEDPEDEDRAACIGLDKPRPSVVHFSRGKAEPPGVSS